MYDAERRIHPETNIPNDQRATRLRQVSLLCPSLAWRRSPEDWKQLAEMHAARFKLPPNEEAIAFLSKAAPLHTPEWDAWSTKKPATNLAGRWLVTASVRGHGKYYGELQVDAAPTATFTTSVRSDVGQRWFAFRPFRTQRRLRGYAWRGRSQGPRPQPRRPTTSSAKRAKSCGSRPIS
jgi:quinohemoprotein amine dehydrogenase